MLTINSLNFFLESRKRRIIRWQQDFATFARCLKTNEIVIHRIINFLRINLEKLGTASVFFKEEKNAQNFRDNKNYKHYAVTLPYSIFCLIALTKTMNGWLNKRKLGHIVTADQSDFKKNVALTQNNDSITLLKGTNSICSICSTQIAMWQKNIDPQF